ncbi:ATP-binding protein [Roseomonas sp. WA12]
MPCIHILGASGSGTTTLGAAVAEALGLEHHDSDRYYWVATDPPFTTPRPLAERVTLLAGSLPAGGDWVLSGSAMNWATPIEPFYDLIVFLQLDPALRMERIRRREVARYGARIGPGGDMERASAAFLAWATAYDSAGPEQRSLVAHEAWLSSQAAPVLRLDSAVPVPVLVRAVSEAIGPGKRPGTPCWR